MKKLKYTTIYILIITIFSIVCQSQSIKSFIIGSSINSSRHQYIARLLFRDEEIKEVLSKNRVCEVKDDIEIMEFCDYTNDNIEVYEINTKTLKGHAMVVYNPLLLNVGYSDNLPQYGEKTSEIAIKNNAIAAINGGGFKYEEKTQKPMGVVIHNKKVIYNELNDNDVKQDIVGFTQDGMLIVGKHSINDLKKINIKEAVTFGPPLIVNGKKVNIEGDGGWGIAQRSAIGQRENGTVILMTLQGRSLKTMGATIKDVQEQMEKYGAINASNLDGGNSATMFYEGKILNKKDSKEIKVPTAIIVRR